MKKENRIRFAKSFGRNFDVFSVFDMHKSSEFSGKQTSTNRWHLSAEGFLLLPSALRPHLLGSMKGISISLILILQSFFIAPVIAESNSEPTAPGVNPDISKETSGSTASGVEGNVNTSKKGNADIGEGTGPSLSLSIPSSFSISELNPNTNNGFSSTSSNISISTTAPWGYELSVKAKDDNVLKNSASSTSKLESITTSIDENTFKTGTTYDNKWGFKPSKLNSAANTNFVAGPTTSPTIIEKTSASSASASQYTIAIGAKADSTLATGTYSNNFTFTAVANTVSYTINYNLNSGSWTGSSPQSGSTTDKTVTISSASPTKSNYEFKGWCTVQPTNNDSTSPTCSGTTINPSGSYTLSNGTNNVNLYAMWMSAGPTDLGDLGTMQNFDCSKISNTEDYGTVMDNRDNNKYKVAKLKDGKCWMIENLRIVGRSISSSNSDMASGSFTIPASNRSNFDVGGVNNYMNNPYNNAAYVDSTYGGYYTWNVATAGTGSSVANAGIATSSICPKGWKLPTGNMPNTDFENLVKAYSGSGSTTSANLRVTPVPGFAYAGYVDYYDNSPLSSKGSLVSYWSSSTTLNKSLAYVLIFRSSGSSVDYTDTDIKDVGNPIRCVIR